MNDASNAVFNCMYLQSDLAQMNLLQMEPLVGMGIDTRRNTRGGGVKSGEARKEESAEVVNYIVDAAKKMLSQVPRGSGKEPRSVTGRKLIMLS